MQVAGWSVMAVLAKAVIAHGDAGQMETRAARPQTSTSDYASPMTAVANVRPGRRAACTREDALQLAIQRLRACERVDVQALARELGVARATMHRWFQTRDGLLGEALATFAETRLQAIRQETKGSGAKALLECFDRFNRELSQSDALSFLLAQEQERA